jgi:nitroreductase
MLIKTMKQIFPPGLFARGRALIYRLKLGVMRLIHHSSLLCSIYYFLFSGAFRREQQAVTAGLVRYLDRSEDESSFYLLRRNIHRLEKGLLMRPRRDIFALDYIEETVDCYTRCKQFPQCEERAEDLIWANDVLETYFAAVCEHKTIQTAQEKFLRVATTSGSAAERIPYKRMLIEPGITYNELLSLAKRRKSVRWFLQTPVPRNLIDKALVVASQAPSACNRQPFRYCIYDAPDMVRRVAALPVGTGGFHQNIPTIAVAIGDLSAYFGERDRHGIYVDTSLSIMLFKLALETLGLSSCPLNWPDITALEKKMAQLLNLQPYERVVMCIAIGYPDPEGMVAYSQKKSGGEIRTFNEPAIHSN